MFDVGFSEMVVIAIVALVVVGPERLPKLARTLGYLFGRLNRYVNDVKSDIEREMRMEELKKLQAEVEESARSVERTVDEQVAQATQEAKGVAESLQPAETSASPAAEHIPGDIPPPPDVAEALSAPTPDVAEASSAPTPAGQLDLSLDPARPDNPAAAKQP